MPWRVDSISVLVQAIIPLELVGLRLEAVSSMAFTAMPEPPVIVLLDSGTSSAGSAGLAQS